VGKRETLERETIIYNGILDTKHGVFPLNYMKLEVGCNYEHGG